MRGIGVQSTYIGSGLVFQAALDGANVTAPREVYLSPISDLGPDAARGPYCDGLDTLNGYIDATGAAHFLAAISRNHDASLSGKSAYQLIENGKPGEEIDLPDLSFRAYGSFPRLLVDAAGGRHAVALYPTGERPNVRDYLLGSGQEPVIIRAAAAVKGMAQALQACQGPGGRMVAIMQINDTGERGAADTYVSISTGKGWSKAVNVTNNSGRRSFASKQTGSRSNVAIIKSCDPGPAAAAFDRDGHLLLLMINSTVTIFRGSSFGVQTFWGSFVHAGVAISAVLRRVMGAS